MPVSCKLANDALYTLSPAGAKDGGDRRSRTAFVSYGRYGFYFDEPGQYVVRVVCHGPGNLIIPSNTHRLRIVYASGIRRASRQTGWRRTFSPTKRAPLSTSAALTPTSSTKG